MGKIDISNQRLPTSLANICYHVIRQDLEYKTVAAILNLIICFILITLICEIRPKCI